MAKTRITIVGDGMMAQRCAAAVRERPDMILAARVRHRNPRWPHAADKLDAGVPTAVCDDVNEPSVLELLRDARPDLLVNAGSDDIVRAPLLALPAQGAINFHNGPLPRYRGINIPTWAIYNGETEHGVTWHFMQEGIDTGDIVAQERFPLTGRETAIDLTFACLEKGIGLFRRLLDAYAREGRLERRPQTGPASRYRRAELPNDGMLDLDWGPRRLSRFIRAFSLRPFFEPELFPHLDVRGRRVYVATLRGPLEGVGRGPGDTGRLLEVREDALVARSCGARVELADFFDERRNPLPPAKLVDSLDLRVGDRLHQSPR